MSSSRNESPWPAALGDTIHPAPFVTQAVRGDETVLADLRAGRYYTLSPVGSRIWELVCEGITMPALLARLHEEYDAPPERVDADATAFLRTLHGAQLIVSAVS